MKTILLERKQNFNYKEYIRRTPVESDYSTLIKEDYTFLDRGSGQLLGVYLTMSKHSEELLKALLTIKYDKNRRLAGLITKSRIFGYKPREKIRNDFCTSTQLAKQSPKEHAIICNFAKVITKIYKKYCGEIYEEHAAITKEKLLPDWTIAGTPFTSGIVNRNNALHYHFDTGNYKNVYSNMVAFKSNTTGGYLAIPEYDIGLEIANNSLLLFDGQKILHGVTPIKLLSVNAFRLSIVYYSLQQMWKCEPLTVELARIKDVRTELEKKRLLRMKGVIPNEI
ncbi:MAG: hypothetical protein QQN44_01825 [Nitrosopumilus sp.]